MDRLPGDEVEDAAVVEEEDEGGEEEEEEGAEEGGGGGIEEDALGSLFRLLCSGVLFPFRSLILL